MNWQAFTAHTLHIESLDMLLDASRAGLTEDLPGDMRGRFDKAFEAMAALERGAIANPDENRMVGHYWLRNTDLAPDESIAGDITETNARIRELAGRVHSGEIRGSAGLFENLLLIGIGGSALGPQFVAQALGDPASDNLTPYFFDNTDPDGMDQVLAHLEGKLGRTLAIVISKSGGTPETRNGMIEAEAAWKEAGLDFAKHAIAVTGENSKLDRHAASNGWLARFPMWDWVGGRTSVTGPVGLLPAALQGLDIDSFLEGARIMDEATREPSVRGNPAALLALCWHELTGGKGEKDMVVLPYKDRLMLFSRYLQQLVMESLGKEKDLDGKTVNQGIAVYGNKGSTDQHAYVQQLREGVNNFFVTFIEVLRGRVDREPVAVEEDTTSGDYLEGFLLGTREALSANGRASITVTVPEVAPHTVGALIALYERAVGLYASLVNINAYHQPGVEAGKKAAADILALQGQVLACLRASPGKRFTADELAQALGREESKEAVFKLLDHLAANEEKKVFKEAAKPFYDARFGISG